MTRVTKYAYGCNSGTDLMGVTKHSPIGVKEEKCVWYLKSDWNTWLGIGQATSVNLLLPFCLMDTISKNPLNTHISTHILLHQTESFVHSIMINSGTYNRSKVQGINDCEVQCSDANGTHPSLQQLRDHNRKGAERLNKSEVKKVQDKAVSTTHNRTNRISELSMVVISCRRSRQSTFYHVMEMGSSSPPLAEDLRTVDGILRKIK